MFRNHSASEQAYYEPVSDVDGRLFAIKHLLVLREQISPFEPDLAAHSVPVRELDFFACPGTYEPNARRRLELFLDDPRCEWIALARYKWCTTRC